MITTSSIACGSNPARRSASAGDRRKVRRLRERYPEITCKIFYQRDYLSLVTKYGLRDARSFPQEAPSLPFGS